MMYSATFMQNSVLTPYLCTVVDNGERVFSKQLRLPLGAVQSSVFTYTSRILHNGQQVHFNLTLIAGYSNPFVDTIIISESIYRGMQTMLLQSVCCNTEMELLSFHAVNTLGIQFNATRNISSAISQASRHNLSLFTFNPTNVWIPLPVTFFGNHTGHAAMVAPTQRKGIGCIRR